MHMVPGSRPQIWIRTNYRRVTTAEKQRRREAFAKGYNTTPKPTIKRRPAPCQ